MALTFFQKLRRESSLPSLEKDEIRIGRELAKSNKELDEAQSLSEHLHATGAADDEIDAAERRVTLANRQLKRLDIERKAVCERRAELVRKARAERRARLRREALEEANAHIGTARAAAATAARYTAARQKLEAEGFADVCATLPLLVPTVCDFSFSGSVDTRPSVHFDLLDKFEWSVKALMSEQVAV